VLAERAERLAEASYLLSDVLGGDGTLLRAAELTRPMGRR
jgi:NAD kinase